MTALTSGGTYGDDNFLNVNDITGTLPTQVSERVGAVYVGSSVRPAVQGRLSTCLLSPHPHPSHHSLGS